MAIETAVTACGDSLNAFVEGQEGSKSVTLRSESKKAGFSVVKSNRQPRPMCSTIYRWLL